MIKVFIGEHPKSEKLDRLGRKGRLELVLKGYISDETLLEMRQVVGCPNCKWQNLEGKVYGVTPAACRKPGTKKRGHFTVFSAIDNGKKFGRAIPQCSGFEEK
jgi:hypothetical protein